MSTTEHLHVLFSEESECATDELSEYIADTLLTSSSMEVCRAACVVLENWDNAV